MPDNILAHYYETQREVGFSMQRVLFQSFALCHILLLLWTRRIHDFEQSKERGTLDNRRTKDTT